MDDRAGDSPGRAGGPPPRVAVVGRQNVGKSTLVNRLLGSRKVIAHEDPGVTRDRIEVSVRWRDRTFLAVDTGGFVRGARGLDAAVIRQAEMAMAGADVILLVVDAVAGIQEEDAALADRLRAAAVPILLVANKVDGPEQEPDAASLYRLGLGEPVPVSALHGRGSGDLLDRIVELLPEPSEAGEPEGEAAFSIVGRPNVGKSSLYNRLLGEERTVVSERAGTTRDAVDSLIEWEGQPIRFVDTAGFRRPSRERGVSYYGFLRTVQAIERSHVVALVLDASEGVTTEDRRIAARVSAAGRGLVVAANKWDLVRREDRADRHERIKEGVETFPGAPVVRTSALTGSGVGRVLPALLAVREAWMRRVATPEVNRVLQRAQGQHPLAGGGRIQYGTQVGVGPPRFVVFATRPVTTGYRRFLENRLREAFRFDGVPVVIKARARRQRARNR